MGWFTSKKEKEEKAKKKKEEEEAKQKAEAEEKEAAEKKKKEEEEEKDKDKEKKDGDEAKEADAPASSEKPADGAAEAAAASTATLPPPTTEGAAAASVPPSTAASPTVAPAAPPGAAVPPVEGSNPSLSGSVDPNAPRPEPSPAPLRPKVIVGPPPGGLYPHHHHHQHHGHHHHHHQHAHAYPPHQHHLRQVSSSSNGGLAAPPAGRVPPTRPPPKVVVPPTPGSHQSVPTPRGSEAGDVPPTVYRPPVVVQGGPPQHHHHHHQHAAYQYPPGAHGAAPVVVVPSRGPSAQGSPSSAADAQPQASAYPPPSSAGSVPASPAEAAGSPAAAAAAPGSPAADSQPPSTPPAATPAEEAAAAPSTPPPPADDDAGSDSDSAEFVEEDDDDNTAPPEPVQAQAAPAALAASVPVSRQTSAASSGAAATDNASVAGTDASTAGSAKPQAPSPKRAAAKSAARAPSTSASKSQPRSPLRKTPTTAAPKREKVTAINTSVDTVIERQPDSEPELPSPIEPAADIAQLSRSDAHHVKGWVRDRFARLVCPQQYYGQIQRVHNVRPFTSKPRQIPGNRAFAVYAIRDQTELERLTRAGGVFRGVANDGSHRFTTQVQLDPRSSRRAAPPAGGGPPCRLTTFALCDIPTRRIRFAETAGEAIGSLEEAATAFVTDSSAYVVSDLADVRVHALLDITWSLFSDDTPPVCPQHKVALQLFEPESRQLLCALCTANDMQRGECIVLNDMFSGASLRSIQHSLSERLDDVAHRVSSHVTAHRAAAASSDRRRHAVELQFSLVQAALDAKKAELNAILDEEDRDRDLAASRGIMSETEVRRHLAAALTHVREIGALRETAALAPADDDTVEPTPPLAQMATVVSSLGHIEQSNEPVPIEASRFSTDLDSRLRVNLEHVIRTITDVTFIAPAAAGDTSPGRGRRLSPARAIGSPPQQMQMHHHSEPVEQISPQVQNRLRRHQQQAPSARQRARSAADRSRATRATSPPRATPIAPALSSPTRGGLGPNTSTTLSKKNDKRRRENVRHGNRSPVRRQAEPAPSSIAMLMPPPREHHSHHFEPTTAPNGSVLYDIRVDGLATASTVVEWKVRIDDPGSWVGLGVAVGDSFDSLTNTRTNDTRHLWIAPPTVPRHVRLRVSVGPHKHCKLTVHDTLGRQLDDNRIPHWAPGRLAYPQVSFGDVPGTVTLVEPPRQFPLPGARS